MISETATVAVVHAYPHLSSVKASIKLLYKRLSRQTIASFSKSLDPTQTLPDENNLVVGVQILAGAIARHLQLPKGSIFVGFRKMEHAGRVELTPESDYLVDLHERYRQDHRDIAAVLAHEVTHVFLYRHGIRLPNTLENEILTDTASAYLGVGWLALNAHRVVRTRQKLGGDTVLNTTEEALGYLTPEEFGYVLGKRSLALSESVDGLIKGPAAAAALARGYELARHEHRRPPLPGSGWWERLQYRRDRDYIRSVNELSGLTGRSRQFDGYQFEISDSIRVIFECPICCQKLRLPGGKRAEATCGVCGTPLKCTT